MISNNDLVISSVYKRNMPPATTMIAPLFKEALFKDAEFAVAIGVDALVDEDPLVLVENAVVDFADAVVVSADAAVVADTEVVDASVLSVAVEVALADTVEEVVSLMPHTASASKVKGKFLASHSVVCR